MADDVPVAASGLFPPGEAFPEGVRPLSPDEIGALLRKFPEWGSAGALRDSERGEGVAVDMSVGGELGYWMLGTTVAAALGAFFWIVETVAPAISLWGFLAALSLFAFILVWLAAKLHVDRVFLLFQSGNVFFRADRGFRPSRRLLRPGDIRKILHDEHKSQDPVSRHSVKFLLANGERLPLFSAGTDRGNAVWFLNLLQRRLDVPVELETSYGIGCIPADESESQSGLSREPEQKAVAGVSGGISVPDVRGHSFAEIAVLPPGTAAYEKFRRRMDSTGVPPAMRDRSGFIVREVKFTALAYFFYTVASLVAVWIFTTDSDLTGGMAIFGLLIASLVSALATVLTDNRHFFFTPETLLLCRKNGMILREVSRKSIMDVHGRSIVTSDDGPEKWEISVEIPGEKIPLKDFCNTRAAKWFLDAVRAWVNHIPTESDSGEKDSD